MDLGELYMILYERILWQNSWKTIELFCRHDEFSKMDLDGNYIGDRVPLCADLPEYQFLKKGAKYRLLGSSVTPLLHHQPTFWIDES
jgi:hypothetical protein